MNDKELKEFLGKSKLYSDTSILMHESIARKAGLSGTDHKYLGMIIENGMMTAGELSQKTGLTTGAVTGLIDRFEKKQFVRRQFDKEDRRKIMIVPNEAYIMDTLKPLFENLQKKTEALIESLDEDERKIIANYFSKAISIMKETIEELNQK